MRMARAFIASVPLAIVLVAALVVPLTVIPGTFAFQSWPTSLGGKVSAHRIQVAPAPAATVATRERESRPAASAPGRLSHQPAGRHAAGTGTKKTSSGAGGSTPAPTQNGHRSTAVVEAPAGAGPGRGPGDQSPAPSTPGETPAAPQ